MHRWKLSALAAAAFVSAALIPTDASALALGRIAVQSALGEPLRAEIDIPQVTKAELEALRADIASADIFKAQGMEYSSTARQIQVEVVRQPDGTAKLKLSSRSPLNDPFVDLVIDANWAAGNLVRSYTLLLDPPATPQAAPTVTTAPQLPASTAAAKPAAQAASTPAATTAAPKPASTPAAGADEGGRSITVRSGDTAGRLAGANRHAGVSLDQMLVAMLRANPNAFINGNVNLLRAGSVVQMPSKDAASATSSKEARQIVAAQSRDFNEFRRRVAAKAPEAKVSTAERGSSGQVQAQVQDSSAAAAAADKLTLSKGALAQHAAEEKLAKDKQANAQTDRVGELQRNLEELQRVASASSPATTATASAAGTPATSPAAPAATAGVAVPAATSPAAGLPAADGLATPAPVATDTPSAEASALASDGTAIAEQPVAAPVEAPKPAAPKAVAPPPPAPEPGFIEQITGDNPLVLPLAGGALALLLGLVGWRAVQRRRGQQDADAAGDDQLPPDSFFGNSGGQQVDTRQSTIAGGSSSTMAYSPSQLDAGGDVDPVAEAEVYLAYGRDVQAEEILKEALRTQPERLGVHMKLAEIYAKRKDLKSLETTARAVHPLTQGAGPSWDRMVELGRSIDASNPLYQGGSTPAAPSTSAFADALAKSNGMPAASVPIATGIAGAALSSQLPPDLDLSFDMDLPGGMSDNQHADVAGPSSVLTPSEQDFAALEPRWDGSAQTTATAPSAPTHQPLDLSTLEFSLDEPVAPAKPVAAASPAPNLTTDMGLDLGDLNLDLSPPSTAAPATTADDPLATKLDLAREFHAIGDIEGARTLVEEVIAEASGDLKTRAQHLLSEID